MGRDKALVELRPGVALAEVGVAALRRAGASDVTVVGGDRDALLQRGLPWRPDRHPGEGPLGGIVTALGGAATDLVVVMACDMPEVGADVPGALVDALAAAPAAAVAVALSGEREQPLTACWRRPLALPALEAAFAAGERAPRRVLPSLRVVAVPGLPADQLADVDVPEDLRRYADRHRQPTDEDAP
jgi:molybdopterin-guanine dinucleotide biosynthesis protein A